MSDVEQIIETAIEQIERGELTLLEIAVLFERFRVPIMYNGDTDTWEVAHEKSTW